MSNFVEAKTVTIADLKEHLAGWPSAGSWFELGRQAMVLKDSLGLGVQPLLELSVLLGQAGLPTPTLTYLGCGECILRWTRAHEAIRVSVKAESPPGEVWIDTRLVRYDGVLVWDTDGGVPSVAP